MNNQNNTAQDLSTEDSDSLPTANGGLGELMRAANDAFCELPDGSGFGVMSLPLPKDHWITEPQTAESTLADLDLPPLSIQQVEALRQSLKASLKNALRDATRNGTLNDIDPDCVLQRFNTQVFGAPKLMTWAEVEAMPDPDAPDAPVLIQN